MFHALYYDLYYKLSNSIKINNKLMIISRYFVKAESVCYFDDQYYVEWYLPEESSANVVLSTKIHSTESCSAESTKFDICLI